MSANPEVDRLNIKRQTVLLITAGAAAAAGLPCSIWGFFFA
jgi:hypothetical protein